MTTKDAAPYVLAIVAAAVFTIGMPVWAGACVDIAAVAFRWGIVRQEFAPQFGLLMMLFPIICTYLLFAVWMLRRASR